jgi:hypothetical protein
MTNDKATTGQVPAACRVPSARAPESAVLQARLHRERYAWLYDDEDIWAVVQEDDAPPWKRS